MYLRYLIFALIGVASCATADARVSMSQSRNDAQLVTVLEHPRHDAARAFADRVTLEQAVRQVRKQYGGRIVSAETRGSGGGRQHVIKVLTDKGRVVTVRIPAN